MQYEKLVEFPLEASLANFKSAMELFITRPHLVDKRTSGATILSRFLSSEDSLTCDFPDQPELELTPNEEQKEYLCEYFCILLGAPALPKRPLISVLTYVSELRYVEK